jgi:hypothetical protein
MVLLVVSSVINFQALASSVTYLNNSNTPTFIQGDIDKLIVNNPNNHGVSYNRVNSLVLDKKLLVIPTNYLPNNADNRIVKTIVIHANSVSLGGELILGAANSANIVIIIDKSNGQLSCNNCQFSGFPRITLATAKSNNTLNNSINTLGNLENIEGSLIRITNLSAPDANSVEFHSQSIATSGNIKSTFYAKKSGDEYVIGSSGDIGVNAGFSFFTGPLSVNYDTHELINAKENTTTANTFSGKIHGAGISIVSARPVTIAKGTTLTTQSDFMATGHVGDEFFVPTGNIDIVTTSAKSSYGKILNQGSLMSDTAVNVSSSDFENTGMTSSNTSQLAVKETIKNTGYIEASGSIELSSRLLDNRKHINANAIRIYSKDAFFNHLGGRVLGNEVSIETSYLINGARQEIIPSISQPSSLSLQTELVAAANYGIFNSNAMTKPSQPVNDVSAHITAVNLAITAEKIENINPYFKERTNSVEIWDGKVALNYAKSRRVSITSQNILDLYAKDYIVNSSAILGLESNGVLTINTPVFQNERYRLDTNGYIFARRAQNSTEEKHHSIGTEVETHVDAISPMATFYSYGRLNHSPLTSTASTSFSNLMSFMQIHGKSNFFNTNFSSIAIMTSSQTDAEISTACIVNNCGLSEFQDNYTRTTFTSFLDDVDGLSSDIIVETKVQVEDYIQGHVDAYIAEHVEKERTAFLGNGGRLDRFYYNVRVDEYNYGDVLVITTYTCAWVGECAGQTCTPKEHSKGVTEIAVETAQGGIIPGTQQTDAQIKEMATIYLGNLNIAGSVERLFSGRGSPHYRTLNGFWKGILSSYEIGKNASNQIEITLRYYKRFYRNEALTNEGAQAGQDANPLYTKNVTYLTFITSKPKKTVTLNNTYNSQTGALVLNWAPVLVPNVTYEIQGSGLPDNYSNPTLSSRSYIKKSSGEVKYRVRACTQYNGAKLCGPYSNYKSQTITYEPPTEDESCRRCGAMIPFNVQNIAMVPFNVQNNNNQRGDFK